ncbi:MAG: hypothetical protein RIQ33_948 [Bacteroidota bacterium]|jgi:hypothetical protein
MVMIKNSVPLCLCGESIINHRETETLVKINRNYKVNFSASLINKKYN